MARASKAKSAKLAKRPKKPAAAQAKQSFVSGLMARGEAAVAKNGRLPPGATHEVVGKDAVGGPVVQRRRFSLT